MIECAGIRDETGMDCRIWRPGLLGFMLSMAKDSGVAIIPNLSTASYSWKEISTVIDR